MSTREIIFIIVSFISGFVIAKILEMATFTKYHNDVAKSLVRSMQYEEELAKKNGYDSSINCALDLKGKDFVIYYFGEIFRLLSGANLKDKQFLQIKNALGEFLNNTLSAEVNAYRESRKKKNKKEH